VWMTVALSLVVGAAAGGRVLIDEACVVIGGYGISRSPTPQEVQFWNDLAASNATTRFSTQISSTSPVSRAYSAIAFSLLEPLTASNTLKSLLSDTNAVTLVKGDMRYPETVRSITISSLQGAFVWELAKHRECHNLFSRHPMLGSEAKKSE
jgi:hypothetical protein